MYIDVNSSMEKGTSQSRTNFGTDKRGTAIVNPVHFARVGQPLPRIVDTLPLSRGSLNPVGSKLCGVVRPP